jgi:hypothetical protein
MDNWLANIVDDVDSLHVEIDNLNDLLVGFCFIRSIDNKLFWVFTTPSVFYRTNHLIVYIYQEKKVHRFSPVIYNCGNVDQILSKYLCF